MPKSPSEKLEPSPSNKDTRLQHKTSGLSTLKIALRKLADKVIGKRPQNPFYETIKHLKASSEKMSHEEKELLHNFLKFNNKTVEEVMIPRSDIKAVKSNVTIEELNELINTHSHTRTPVYEDSLDNIIGFIHIKDLFMVITKKQNFQIKKMLRKPIVSAPSMKLIDLLAEMQRRRTHISIVVDEYGCTDGIVTIEDIMEEIVGSIEDELEVEVENNSYKILNSNTIIASARFEVRDLEEIIDKKLKKEDDEFETLGGLILAKAGSMPKVGSVINIDDDIKAEILEAGPRSLKKVKITLPLTKLSKG